MSETTRVVVPYESMDPLAIGATDDESKKHRDTLEVDVPTASLLAVVQPDETVLLLCRSGVRSHHAARVAHDAGFDNVFNVLEGFEGQRNHAYQRGFVDGWRSHGLPWIQD